MKIRFIKRTIYVSIIIFFLCGCSNPDFQYGTYVSDSGSYQLILNNDGSVTFLEFGKVVTEGTFSIKNNELTWESDIFCDSSGNVKATYTWKIKEGTLVLKVKGKDRCSERLYVLNEVTYHFIK